MSAAAVDVDDRTVVDDLQSGWQQQRNEEDER